MHHETQPERRKTRTLAIGPFLKGILVTGATAATLSVPVMTWHALKTMWAVQSMRNDYNVIMRQNLALQLQTHRLTDAVNDLRQPLGLKPLEMTPLVTPPDLEATSLALTSASMPRMRLPVAQFFHRETVAIREPSTVIKASR